MNDPSRLTLLTAGLAALLPSSAMSLPPASQSERQINVSGEAEVRVAPDQVQISLGVLSVDKSLAKAKAANDERMKRTMAALQRLGIEPKHMQTDHLSVEPRRDNVSYSKWSDTPDAFEVRKNLVVTLKDLRRFEEVVSAVIEAGTNEIQGIDFQTTELRKHRDAARAMALKAAREKATAMAAELGLKIGKARQIQEGGGGWSYFSAMGRRGGAMAQNVFQNVAGGGSGQESDDGFAPGLISVRASVSISFDLE